MHLKISISPAIEVASDICTGMTFAATSEPLHEATCTVPKLPWPMTSSNTSLLASD